MVTKGIVEHIEMWSPKYRDSKAYRDVVTKGIVGHIENRDVVTKV